MAYIIRETAKGLKYLHESNLLHRFLFCPRLMARDVKAGNILVDDKGNVSATLAWRVSSRAPSRTRRRAPSWARHAGWLLR